MNKETILEWAYDNTLVRSVGDTLLVKYDDLRAFLNSLPEIEGEQICPDCEADWLLTPFPYHARICICDNCLEYKTKIAKRLWNEYQKEMQNKSITHYIPDFREWLDNREEK